MRVLQLARAKKVHAPMLKGVSAKFFKFLYRC